MYYNNINLNIWSIINTESTEIQKAASSDYILVAALEEGLDHDHERP